MNIQPYHNAKRFITPPLPSTPNPSYSLMLPSHFHLPHPLLLTFPPSAHIALLEHDVEDFQRRWATSTATAQDLATAQEQGLAALQEAHRAVREENQALYARVIGLAQDKMELMSRVAVLEQANRESNEEMMVMKVATHLDRAMAKGKLGEYIQYMRDFASSHTFSSHPLITPTPRLFYPPFPCLVQQRLSLRRTAN